MSISLTALIKEQAYECLVMFGCGLAFMIMWQVCSFFSRRWKIRTWVRILLEIGFWLVVAAVVSEFLFYCSYGKISVHSIIAFGAGLLLWKHRFYDIMTPRNYS